MSRTTRTLFVLLAAFFSVWSTSALLGNPAIRSSWQSLGIDYTAGTLIAFTELTAALGLVVGLRRPYVGACAAAWLVAMMAGAVTAHFRVGDVLGAHGAVVVGLVSAGALASVVADIRDSQSPGAGAGHLPFGVEPGEIRWDGRRWGHGRADALKQP